MNKQNGYTILEALVSVAITAVIALVLFGLLFIHMRITNMGSGNSILQKQRTIIEQELEESIHLTTHVVASATINGVLYQSSISTLILELPSIDNDGFVITDAFDYVVYYLDGARLLTETESNPLSARQSVNKELSDSVGEMNFWYNNSSLTDASLVRVDLTLQKAIFSKKQIISLQNIFYLRNK